MGVFVIAIIIGLLPAAIAQSKGKNFLLWWFYGAALFIVALPHSLLMSRDQDSIDDRSMSEGNKKCRYCAEIIRKEAIACRFCGRDIAAA